MASVRQDKRRKPLSGRTLCVRLSVEERRDLDKLAELMGLAPSTLVRALIVEQLQDQTAVPLSVRRVSAPVQPVTSEVLAMRQDIKRVGTNLNQIARRLNAGQSADATVGRWLMEARDVMSQVLSAFGDRVAK